MPAFNGASHILLALVPTDLQAAIEMIFTGEFLLILKIDISKPRCSPMPIQYVPESPQCQLSNATAHILLASPSTELLAAMELAFTREFLLTLKTDISKPRCLPMPIRCVLESPQCQLSNATSHGLLASVPGIL
ncbi:hypothetical protein L873DRAFT_1794231 [Choiromyces venosus 120613-1]|uniref:Uncharacterized protein n=1 Tax=Choiromyces venosus 120613-1 TaxID=1336337 RepID=A0A3N4J7M3_9PEZI|nr:hypothetical protein L873DRAFT_1794231 [Choiromyces venosus 120613-1]